MRKHQCSKFVIFITLCVFLAAFTGCSKKEDNTNNAAMIDGVPITKTDLNREMTRIQQRFYNNSKISEKQSSQIEGEVLDILIGGELLFQASKKKGVDVTKEEINAEMEKAKQSYPDTENFKNTFSEDEIQRKIAIEKFISLEFSDTTVISDVQSKKYYQDNLDDFTRPEQVLASHILIKVEENADQNTKDAARTKITEVQEKLKNSGDFSALAKEYSDDPSSASGGTLGYFMRGQMVKPFEEVAFNLEPEAVSDIVETKFGFHLIKVIDKKPTVVVAFEEIEEKLKSFLKQQEVQAKLEKFIKSRRAEADIKIF